MNSSMYDWTAVIDRFNETSGASGMAEYNSAEIRQQFFNGIGRITHCITLLHNSDSLSISLLNDGNNDHSRFDMLLLYMSGVAYALNETNQVSINSNSMSDMIQKYYGNNEDTFIHLMNSTFNSIKLNLKDIIQSFYALYSEAPPLSYTELMLIMLISGIHMGNAMTWAANNNGVIRVDGHPFGKLVKYLESLLENE